MTKKSLLFVMFFFSIVFGNIYNLAQNTLHKRLPVYTLVNFINSQCFGSVGNGTRTGTCVTVQQCLLSRGRIISRCAGNYGVCCSVMRSCSTTSGFNNTEFVNPGYPRSYNSTGTCSFTIRKSDPNVCQLKLNFQEFRLKPPLNGLCDVDAFVVSCEGTTNVPILCGNNSGQHVYISFPKNIRSCSIDVTTNARFNRRWNVLIEQILCNSVDLAPSGCLQYYRSVSGTIQSFNTDGIGVPGLSGFTYPLRLNYGICIRNQNGFCSIRYSLSANRGYFQLDFNSINGNNITCPDYLLIPQSLPQQSDQVDRYCGENFFPVTSVGHPFDVYVSSDDEAQGGEGFKLDFMQLPCSSS